jgi:hypothetical protein
VVTIFVPFFKFAKKNIEKGKNSKKRIAKYLTDTHGPHSDQRNIE